MSTPDERSRNAPPGRVLIIEDNHDAAETLRLILEIQGHEVRVESDGPSAIEVLKHFDPEVVLLDIGLPGMNGYEVAQRVREHEERKDLLLIAMTGYSQPEDVERSLDSGIDHHLVKPVAPEMLNDLLSRHRGREGLDAGD